MRNRMYILFRGTGKIVLYAQAGEFGILRRRLWIFWALGEKYEKHEHVLNDVTFMPI